jgi:hypothetical protein
MKKGFLTLVFIAIAMFAFNYTATASTVQMKASFYKFPSSQIFILFPLFIFSSREFRHWSFDVHICNFKFYRATLYLPGWSLDYED